MQDLFVPKHDLDAEESLLASLFLDDSNLDECLDLAPEDFYKLANQTIYSAILILKGKKIKADLVTIAHQLNEDKHLEAIGGASYLSQIADSAPMSLNVSHHAKIIKECALARKIFLTALQISDMCKSNEPTYKILGFAQSAFLQIENKEIEETLHKLKEVINPHIDRIELINTKKIHTGIKTGFPVIDKRLIVKEGKLIIIAGRPGMGKTSLAVSMARNMDRSNIKVGFLNLEMSETGILDKFLAIESGVDSSKFDQYKGLSSKDYESLVTGGSILSGSEILIDSTGSLDFIQIAQRARRMVKEGIKVLFIDQLSQMKGMNSAEDKDRFARYSENVNRIALLKKELNIPIFLLAQLNRKLEQRINKEPMLSDLKMTGNIEEDADSVLFVYRPGMYENTENLSDEERALIESKTVLNLAKNRQGGTVRTDLILFNNKTQYFYMKEFKRF